MSTEYAAPSSSNEIAQLFAALDRDQPVRFGSNGNATGGWSRPVSLTLAYERPVKTEAPKFRQLAALLLVTALLAGCATTYDNDHPPCRRVDATEFMRPHTFKGVATDRFIGITQPLFPAADKDERRAFKEIWEVGNFHGWAVLWIPASELPSDYLTNALSQPNRPSHPSTP